MGGAPDSVVKYGAVGSRAGVRVRETERARERKRQRERGREREGEKETVMTCELDELTPGTGNHEPPYGGRRQ